MEKKPDETSARKIALQVLLPLFPVEATLINSLLAVQNKGGIVYYFNGSMPIFTHNESDIDSFRYITSQLIINGHANPKR